MTAVSLFLTAQLWWGMVCGGGGGCTWTAPPISQSRFAIPPHRKELVEVVSTSSGHVLGKMFWECPTGKRPGHTREIISLSWLGNSLVFSWVNSRRWLEWGRSWFICLGCCYHGAVKNGWIGLRFFLSTHCTPCWGASSVLGVTLSVQNNFIIPVRLC